MNAVGRTTHRRVCAAPGSEGPGGSSCRVGTAAVIGIPNGIRIPIGMSSPAGPGTKMTRGEPLEEPSFQLPKLLEIGAAGPFTSWPRSLRLNTRVEANLNGGSAARKRRSRILREKRSTAAAAERRLPHLTHGAHPVAQTE